MFAASRTLILTVVFAGISIWGPQCFARSLDSSLVNVVAEQIAREAAGMNQAQLTQSGHKLIELANTGEEVQNSLIALISALQQMSQNHPDRTIRLGAKKFLAGVQQAILELQTAQQPQEGPPSQRPQPVTAPQPDYDPIPRPDIHWIHGSYYSRYQFELYRQWVQRQTHLNDQQKQHMIRQEEENTDWQKRQEEEWTKSTFRSGF